MTDEQIQSTIVTHLKAKPSAFSELKTAFPSIDDLKLDRELQRLRKAGKIRSVRLSGQRVPKWTLAD